MNAPSLRCWTVWDCESPSTGERVRIVHTRYPDDHKFAHAYQKIAWQGMALTRDEALQLAAAKAQEVRS